MKKSLLTYFVLLLSTQNLFAGTVEAEMQKRINGWNQVAQQRLNAMVSANAQNFAVKIVEIITKSGALTVEKTEGPLTIQFNTGRAVGESNFRSFRKEVLVDVLTSSGDACRLEIASHEGVYSHKEGVGTFGDMRLKSILCLNARGGTFIDGSSNEGLIGNSYNRDLNADPSSQFQGSELLKGLINLAIEQDGQVDINDKLK